MVLSRMTYSKSGSSAKALKRLPHTPAFDQCFINKIKHFRRIATRYDKTAQAFMSMICITCMMVWRR